MKTRNHSSGLLSVSLVPMMGMMVATSAQAATITWSVFNITNDGTGPDVSTNGTLVEAHGGIDILASDNVTDGDTITVNGVTFDDTPMIESPTHNDTLAGSVGVSSNPYREFLGYQDRHSSGQATVAFTNLTIDAEYEIQVWVADNRSTELLTAAVLNQGGVVTIPNPGTAGHATLYFETTTGGSGQYAIGQFVADATTQKFLVKKYGNMTTTPVGNTNLQVAGVQLRKIADPPPSPGTLIYGK